MKSPFLDKVIVVFSGSVVAPRTTRLFSLLVYLWLILNAVYLLQYSEILWSKNKIFYRHGIPGNFLENFFYQLVWHPSRFTLIYSLHLGGALLGLADRRWAVIPRMVAWITGIIIFYSAVPAFNSGMMLMIQMAFLASVIYARAKTPIGIVLTNAARWACIIQLSIVYFVAGVYKLNGDQWVDGSAVYYLLHIDHFATPWAKDLITNYSGIYKTLTWIGLTYQLLFPFIVWLKKGRWIFLSIGVAFHLFIGCVMHLWDFAFAMLICYTLFLNEEKVKSFLSRFSLKKKQAVSIP